MQYSSGVALVEKFILRLKKNNPMEFIAFAKFPRETKTCLDGYRARGAVLYAY